MSATSPRFICVVQPDSNNPGEGVLSPVANADDVTSHELGLILLAGANKLLRGPPFRISTQVERVEEQRVAALVASHPAVKLLVLLPEERQLLIGAEALAAHGPALTARGWVGAGAAPAGRACEIALDPATLERSLLPEVEAPN